jgi:hypothetical protein
MRVHVENDIYIQGDRLNFSVDRITTKEVADKKTGEMKTEENVRNIGGNFATLAQAINGVLKVKVSESKATTLEELLREVKEHRKFIEKMTGGF